MTDWMSIAQNIVGWALLAAAGLPVVYLTLLTLAALVPRRAAANREAERHRFTIVVPAHNEALFIAETVTGLLGQEYPGDRFQVVVIADHCTDETASLARASGARVIERNVNPGKGQALNDAFGQLLSEDWDAFLIVDADTKAHPRLLTRISAELGDGAPVVQVYYGVLNPGESTRTAVMETALASFNGLRPKGKTRLGLSSGLFGNGFCVTRQVLETVPYLAGSVVEDLEYHHRLLESRIRVRFLDDVWVKAQMPATAQDAASQRVRWERGRWTLIRTLVPGLIRRLLRGDRHALEPLLELGVPPVGSLVLLLGIALICGPLPVRLLSILVMALLVLHYVLASIQFGSLKRMVRVLFFTPWYLVWKVWVLASSLFSQKKLPWVRTKRH